MTKLDVDAIASEIANDNFDDKRLTARLRKIVEAAGRDPTASLPDLMNSAELEGAYRFFSNPRVASDAILMPHLASTKQRVIEGQTRVRVVHDQTEFNYRSDGKRRFGEGQLGFRGHFSLVIADGEHRRPLGLAGVRPWVRGELEKPEHSLWFEQIEASAKLLDCGEVAVHVADRGAEDFVLFHDLMKGNHRFVIRIGNRYTESGPNGSHERLREVITHAPVVAARSVPINRRKREARDAARKIHPPREARVADLHIAAMRITLARTLGNDPATRKRLQMLPPQIKLNAVRVWEPEPPDGAEPVEWFLVTNEAIDSAADVCAIVDHYRARWRIEEYFKALKTGCAFSKRQVRDYESLTNVLATYAPLAYRLLLLRTEARERPDAPASTVVSPDQIDVLRTLGRRKLPANPTVRDVLLAVAALGGHIKSAPDPGWLTIARGLEKLELLTAGWCAAKLQSASDQR